MKAPNPHKPLVELRTFLAHWLAEARRLPGCAYVFDLLGLQQIGAEATAHSNASAASAYEAERLDNSAAHSLRGLLRDGRISRRELPALRRVLRLIDRSAATDHRLTHEMATPTK